MAGDYSRREFLKTVVITAGAVQLAGCGGTSSGTPDGGPRPDSPGADGPGADGPGPDAGASPFTHAVISGDPGLDSIVLWTRAVPAGGGDAALTIEVATDMGFTQLVSLSTSQVTAAASADNCVRVKVVGLTAGTRYYYRFKAGAVASPVGRFKTAPAAGTDAQIKFAVLSCQDYIGRYYNTLLALLDPANDDIDFVYHIGDYIYETTGNPGFQTPGARGVIFSDTAGALSFGSGDSQYYAAQSLSNYRDLYKTYRSDPILQQVHLKFPFIMTWDDHEFANDCWQDVATDYDGLKGDEHEPERRRNAEQAFFEYQAVALDAEGTGVLALTRDQLWPNVKLYRDFRFGKNVHLITTDFRSFRPDHPIPEDGFPGTVVMDETTVRGVVGQQAFDAGVTAGLFRPYVNIDEGSFTAAKATALAGLGAAYTAAGLDAGAAATKAQAVLTGNIDLGVLNQFLPTDSAIPDNGRSHGISYAGMGKASLFAPGGVSARYLIIKPNYDIWRGFVAAQDAEKDDPYQATQQQWLDGRLAAESDATWKILGSSTSQTSLIVDLTPFKAVLPPGVPGAPLYLDCDSWDGFPAGRDALHAKLAPKNVVIVSGDIHAAYVADFGADDSGNRLVELTGSSVSSQVFAEELSSEAMQIPALKGSVLVATLIAQIDGLMKSANPKLVYANSKANGVLVVTATGTTLTGVYSLLDATEATTDSTGSPDVVKGKLTTVTATVTKTAGKNGPVTIS
jgi:alkaline phosphatase D